MITRGKPYTQQDKTADEAGWNSRALEAQIFAYLAVRHLKGLPTSYPQTTGVPYPIVGGQHFDP
jgi:anhydro-N-acetylmuramic acid kinase